MAENEQFLESIFSKSTGESGVILCELNHIFKNHPAVAYLAHALSHLHNSKIRSYVPLTRDGWSLTNPTLQVAASFYKGFGAQEFFEITPSEIHFSEAKKILLDNFHLLQDGIDGVSQFELHGIAIGPHMCEAILQSLGIVEFDSSTPGMLDAAYGYLARFLWWEEYLKTTSVKAIVVSHPCYEFFTPALIGATLGVESFVVRDFRVNRVKPDFHFLDGFLSPEYDQASSLFNHLPEVTRHALLGLAERELTGRLFKGAVEGPLKYDPRVKSSQEQIDFNPEDYFSNTLSPKVVFFLHAFSDAPCHTPKTNDGYLISTIRSTKQILAALLQHNIGVCIKTHSSLFPEEESAVNVLLQAFPSVKRLPSEVSLVALQNGGIETILTGYGSVAVEGAFLGMRVLNYSPFSPTRSFGIAESFSTLESLVQAISTPRLFSVECKRKLRLDALRAYAYINLRYASDVAIQNLGDIRRKYGDLAAYSPQVYQHWIEELDFVKHMASLNLFRKFAKEGSCSSISDALFL